MLQTKSLLAFQRICTKDAVVSSAVCLVQQERQRGWREPSYCCGRLVSVSSVKSWTRLKCKPVRAKPPCKDWLEDDEKGDFKASTKAQAEPISVRPAEFPDDKAASIAVPKADKVARPHHASHA